MFKMKLKHLKIEILKTFGKLDKSICIKCKHHLYEDRHTCRLYPHKYIDYVCCEEHTDYELCKSHNFDGNCPFFKNKFNE